MLYFSNKILTIIAASIFILSSCGMQNENTLYEHNLVIDDTIKIQIPTTVPDIALSNKWYYDHKGLSLLNTINNEIELYHYVFDTKEWNSYSISGLSKGYIQHPGSFAYLNDSILLYNHYLKNELLFYNFKTGVVENKHSFREGYGIIDNKTLDFYTDSLKIILPIMYLNLKDENYIDKAKLAFVFNIKNNESHYIGKFPDKFYSIDRSRTNLMIPDIIINSDFIVLSYKREKELYLFSIEQNVFRSVICADPKLPLDVDYRATDDSFMDAAHEEFGGLYKALLYDELNRNYYRISVSYPGFKGDLPNSIEMLNILGSKRELRATVLNEDFQIIAQTKLPNVSENNCFIKDGRLYMRSNYNTENVITYIGFKISKAEP